MGEYDNRFLCPIAQKKFKFYTSLYFYTEQIQNRLYE